MGLDDTQAKGFLGTRMGDRQSSTVETERAGHGPRSRHFLTAFVPR